MRIKTYLAGMVAAVILPLGIAALLAIDKVREGQRSAALEALHATVRATALVVDCEVQKSLGALEVLSSTFRETACATGLKAQMLAGSCLLGVASTLKGW